MALSFPTLLPGSGLPLPLSLSLSSQAGGRRRGIPARGGGARGYISPDSSSRSHHPHPRSLGLPEAPSAAPSRWEPLFRTCAKSPTDTEGWSGSQ